jgi:hypothetical protein
MILVDSRGTTMELFEQGLTRWRTKKAGGEETGGGGPVGSAGKRQTKSGNKNKK